MKNRFVSVAILILFSWKASSADDCLGTPWSKAMPKNAFEFRHSIENVKKKDLLKMALGESRKAKGQQSLESVLWLYLAKEEKKPLVRKRYFKYHIDSLKKLGSQQQDPEIDPEVVDNFWPKSFVVKNDVPMTFKSLCKEIVGSELEK